MEIEDYFENTFEKMIDKQTDVRYNTEHTEQTFGKQRLHSLKKGDIDMLNRNQDMRNKGRANSEMNKEKERRSARRRAAAARRLRISEGDHEQAYKDLHERLGKIAASRTRGQEGRRGRADRKNRSAGWKARSGQMFRAALLAVCLAAILCFSPLTGIFHYDSEQVEASAPVEDVSYRLVEISKGDSLWSIAKRYYKPEYVSIPAMVEEIRECNSLEGDCIYAGSYLMIPVY